ncbi:hypothetical protein [Streptomyces sp. NPDC050848]|uniref:hypothetical protein n=1 Tax=Streptomyces sp. NPDC050848 TaxID=3155791 RepID=UPI0033D27E63
MTTPPRDEFERMMQQSGFGQEPGPSHHNGYGTPATPAYDPNPYGAPHPLGPKSGLTKRGKAALGIGAAVLAGGGLIAYQSYETQAAKDAAIAKELDLKAQALRLEEMKEKNRAYEAGKATQKAEEKARQTSINSCVNDNKNLVGKGYGSPTYRQVIDDCQAQYGSTNTATDVNLQNAGSSTLATGSQGDGGTISGTPLLGIGALAALALWGARKATKPTPA